MEIEYPTYWEAQDKEQQVFLVKTDSLEYSSISDRFAESLPHATIKKIERNQNR